MIASGVKTGEKFGDYQVIEEIASGGMGAVFRAKDTTLDRIVALKVTTIPAGSSLRAVRTFIEEAQAAAKLEHPSIIPIYSAGEANGMAYFAMKYVEGRSLSDIMKEGTPTFEETFSWMYEIAEALKFTHRNGIVHLDVKPGNIMIDSEGHALLVDFGLARAFNRQTSEADRQITVSLDYASPEQIKNSLTDQRSDIYSLGLVFFELLTGRSPYGASGIESVRAKLTTDPPSVLDVNPEVPKEVAALLDKMIKHKRTERINAMEEVAAILAAYRRGDDGAINPELMRITDKIKKIPPFPHVGLQLMKELKREATNADRLSKIINADSVMAARILRVVNSAYYGVPNRVTTIKLAVSLLGLRQIQDLTYGIYLRELGHSFYGGTTELLQRYWSHSVAVAFLAESISRTLSLPTVSPAEAYMAGLLHDMGLLLLTRYEAKNTALAMKLQAEKRIPPDQAEKEVMGVDHTELAAWLDGRWNLPDSLRETAVHHHRARPDSYLAELETVIRLADVIALRNGYGFYIVDYGWTLEEPLFRMLQLSRSELTNDNLIPYLEKRVEQTLVRLGEYLAAFAESSKTESGATPTPTGTPRPVAKPVPEPPTRPAVKRGLFRRIFGRLFKSSKKG